MPSSSPKESPKPSKPHVKERKKRRVVTPLLLQMHMTECAAACLGSVLAYFGRWVPLAELRDKCEISRDGSTAAGIKRAAQYYGLECSGWFGDVAQIKKNPLPLILFWEYNHFLILEGYDRGWFYLNDPASGRRKLSRKEFEGGFTGVALRFKLGPEFKPGGMRPDILQHIPAWLAGTGDALAYAIGCGLLLTVLALATPALLAIFVDWVLREGEPWGGIVAGTMAGAAVLVYGLTWLKQRCLRRLAARISVVAWDQCLTRLLRLPIEFFNHRLAGELSARVLSVDKIAKGLSNRFIDLLIDLGMSVVFLVVMLVYEPTLALIVLGLAVLNAVLMRVISRFRADASHALQREQGLLLGIGTTMLHHTDTLRMTASDDRFFSRWSGHQARELDARQRFSELSHVNSALPGLFSILGSVAVLAVGATEVIAGEMTLGTLMGFYVVAVMFLAPVGRFVSFADDLQSLETDMQRLEDITKAPEDPGLVHRHDSSNSIATLNGRLRLAGHVELRNITFGYNRNRPPLIEDFNLVIKPGQRVAVVGPSGSGKSTLSRLVVGLYQPWSGEILFDGHPRNEIPEEVLSRSLSMVDQNVILFSATVRDNITLWNPVVPDDILIAAARDACIHDEILSRPLGYATQVEEDGDNFSGGQRQRLEIARALVGNPTVLILDEATSALDAATEDLVDDALRRRGISCLIVAHRLSTVRDCDQIIVLEKGKELQRGTHDELMADEGGTYHRLVRAG